MYTKWLSMPSILFTSLRCDSKHYVGWPELPVLCFSKEDSKHKLKEPEVKKEASGQKLHQLVLLDFFVGLHLGFFFAFCFFKFLNKIIFFSTQNLEFKALETVTI